MNYIGEECPVCHKVFTKDDDVVVCPECGSPHHRECYKLENKCAYSDRHGTGYKWHGNTSENINQGAGEPVIGCPVCHSANKASAEVCTRCGSRLRPSAQETSGRTGQYQGNGGAYQGGMYRNGEGSPDLDTVLSYLGYDPNEDMGGGSTLKDVSSFVGNNTLYYIPIFKRMKDLGTKISFNLSCLIFPNLYFANRKMWLWAIIVTILEIICSLPSMFAYMADMINEGIFAMAGTEAIVNFVSSHKNDLIYFSEIFNIVFWAVKIICCIFGNWLYYRFSLNSLKKLKVRGIDGTSHPSAVMAAGGAKPLNMILVLVLMGVIGSAVVAGFIAYPQMLNIFAR